MSFGITTLEIAGFSPSFKGMRNPMNSWEKSDSMFGYDTYNDHWLSIGREDMKLAQNLTKSGAEHCKYLRMIHVWADFNMPRYWWSEFDTYHFNTKNSCSTMHKLLNNPFPITKELFVYDKEDEDILEIIVARLETLRRIYSVDKDFELVIRAKKLLPEGFLQLRTVDTNYAEIMNIYHQRKTHRLKEEWIECFCKWAESLPYFKELCIDPFKQGSDK